MTTHVLGTGRLFINGVLYGEIESAEVNIETRADRLYRMYGVTREVVVGQEMTINLVMTSLPHSTGAETFVNGVSITREPGSPYEEMRVEDTPVLGKRNIKLKRDT